MRTSASTAKKSAKAKSNGKKSVKERAVKVARAAGVADRAPKRQGTILTEGLIGSPILKIAGEVRAMIDKGEQVCNLTVGDFAPSEFPVPPLLTQELTAAVMKGETNYPPSTGMPGLRKAVAAFCERRLGFRPADDQVLITAGARPVIYGAYKVLVDPGDKVVYPVPSWNNVHYCQMGGGVAVPVATDASTSFLPTAAILKNKLRDARMLVLNSPVNPTGTAFTRQQLADICDVILEDNARREGRDRPLYLLYDQMYWMLTYGIDHVHPIALRPDMAKFTTYVDGISKSFAATGLRVGWGVGPTSVMKPMADFLTHVGAWAPRPEQVATTKLLGDDAAIDGFLGKMRGEVLARLKGLADGLKALKAKGHPVDAAVPSGAIYLSARFHLHGKKAMGATLRTDDDVRSYLLHSSGLAAVPFSAFGEAPGSGWFRLSVGAVSMKDIQGLLPRLEHALAQLT